MVVSPICVKRMLKPAKNLNRKMIPLAVSCFYLLIAVAGCNQASSQPPVYGAKVYYALNQPLTFPDLTLEFIGQRKVNASPQFPRDFIFYDFKVSQGNQTQTISWSAGTGDIGPTLFEIGGQNYWLKLAMSDKLGPWLRMSWYCGKSKKWDFILEGTVDRNLALKDRTCSPKFNRFYYCS